MKRITILLILLLYGLTAECDVIFFPRQTSLLSYSLELTYNFEKINGPKGTTCFWGGIGCVGSFYYIDQPTAGFELAIEKRHYFQPDKFEHFFVSAYLGTAYMTDFNNISDIGIVPGFKINYKAQVFPKIVLEPYVSLSVPFTWDTESFSGYVPFPVCTIGVRFGLCKLKTK